MRETDMRFSLQTLLLAFLVIWSALAAFGIRGIFVASVLLGIAAYVRSAQTPKEAIERLVMSILIAVLLLCCITSWVATVPPAPRVCSRRAECNNNLKQLAVALHNYHDHYGCFPPAYVADEEGKPRHSWRVLLLPFLQEGALYDQYDFSQPWNGPNNRRLAGGATMPLLYRCLSDRSGESSATTSYVAVVGSDTAWPGERPRRLSEFRHPSNTILLVEVKNSGIHWMEPRDLTVLEALRGINPRGKRGISSAHVFQRGYFVSRRYAGVNVAFADCSVRYLLEGFPPEMLGRLLSVAGEATADIDVPVPGRPRWDRIMGLSVLVVSYLVLLMRPRPERRRRRTEPDHA